MSWCELCRLRTIHFASIVANIEQFGLTTRRFDDMKCRIVFEQRLKFQFWNVFPFELLIVILELCQRHGRLVGDDQLLEGFSESFVGADSLYGGGMV